MATTKIWPIKGDVGHVLRYVQNEDKTEPSRQIDSLESVLDYVGHGDKTDERQFVSGINCAPDVARLEMNAVKRQFGKTGGRVAYHAYQSFAPGEVTPEQAHQIGVQLANELWGDQFQVVVATHLDRGHLHNHFVINSVSFVNGKRFHSNAKCLRRMRETSDRLCREHGLSVIEQPQQGSTLHHAEINAAKQGHPTWRSLIQADIDRAIAASMTERQFFDTLKAMGYACKLGQDISVRPPGKERFFRLQRNLGDAYSLPEIRRRLGRNPSQRPQTPALPLPERKHYRLKGKLPQKQKSHLRRMYLYYCYRLGVFPKHPQSTAKMHFLLREDLRNLDKYTQEIKLLHTYRLDTDVQLSAFQEQKQQQMDTLIRQRQALRNKLRRMEDTGQIELTKQDISALSHEISSARKEVKLCKDILERSNAMAEKLRAIHRDEQIQRREELHHGYQRTGR